MGWTVPVTAHPHGASPFGAEQLAGNVWEWVGRPHARRLGRRQGRLVPRHRLGPARRAASSPPTRRAPTRTTGFRIAIDPGRSA